MPTESLLNLFPESKSQLQLQSVDFSKLDPSITHLFNEAVDDSLVALKHCRQQSSTSVSSDQLLRIESVLSYIWEHLHTGEWKSVEPAWRQVYSYASLTKALLCLLRPNGDDKEKLVDAITACDMGLIMGEPILEGRLSQIADNIHAMLEVHAEIKKPRMEEHSHVTGGEHRGVGYPQLDAHHSVETFHQPSMEQFLSEIMGKKAAVLTGMMDYWPAMAESRWSVDYLRRVAGHRTVPIEVGSKYTDDSWTQSLTTINQFIDNYITSAKDTGYLAQYQLFHQIPRLKDDIITPDFCYLGESDDVQVNAWFGPKGTVSPLHFDPDHNFLGQVVGAKYIRLYDEAVSSSLYPHEGLLSNTSQVDVENPDSKRFPRFASTPYQECILESGSMLYLPPRMWHYVRSLGTSFSVSFWWK